MKEYQRTGNAVAAAEHHLNMGWRGFSADWIKPKGRGFLDTANPAPRRGNDMADFATDVMEQFYERAHLPSDRH